MSETVAPTGTEKITEEIIEQLHGLGVDELHTIQEFVSYLAWKQQQAKKKSAEERAIERMGDSGDPTKWITVVEEGEEIDEIALNNWLESRGYKEEVPSQTSSESYGERSA
ncbi:hypothetical protein PN498_01615 [Oscillatoria sp. CS-180]|uniref:hypothetical protein n=1 Tax=Oscillatoria sp. CS-180 TaxID=3021720 RepID=UPI00232E0433|nr:hypothetical protein [Oscillatoria sp. CS-180]MDB9524672.1 hypothetical protein [Oscillatoria sp. CS-180]